MTSKEALDKFKSLYESKCKEQPKNLIGFDMCYITIKQALERLEVLELNLDSEKYNLVNENQCLKNRVKDLEISYKELVKENQELKKEIQDLKDNETIVADYGVDLWNENEKLKKAIEIIKSKNVDIFFLVNNCEFVLDNYNYEIEDDIMKYCYKDCSTLTQQECDLFKKVLGDDE